MGNIDATIGAIIIIMALTASGTFAAVSEISTK